MTLEDIKRKTSEACNTNCIYISQYRHCVGDTCFYWNDFDTRIVKTNTTFTRTTIRYPDSQDKIGVYEINDGILQFTIYDKDNRTKEVKAIVKAQEFFKEIISKYEPKTFDNITYNEQEQLFYTENERKDRVGYCMKVAKELGFI